MLRGRYDMKYVLCSHLLLPLIKKETFFSMAQQPIVDQGLLIVEALRLQTRQTL